VLCRLPSGGRVRGRTIPPQQAFGDYLDLRGVGGLLRRAAQAASLDVVAASTPGLEHLLVLGKLKELERTRQAELIVVDAPPAGHAAPFLRSASAIRDLVASGPLRQQADEVSAMLADSVRTQAMIVTLPEETPVNEAIELAFDLEEALGLSLAPLVVNGCWPRRPGLAMPTTTAARHAGITLTAAQRAALVSSSRFGAARLAVQAEQLARLDAQLPLPRLELPRLPTPRLGHAELDELADALAREPTGHGP
jgi:anion-transporting  ArsA/GET3 family ATPase